MSYTMTAAVRAQGLPSLAGVVATLGPDVRLDHEIVHAWPSRPIHLHRDGRSTRGIEVEAGPSALSIRMLACANDADWELAFALFEGVGVASIDGEDGTTARIANARRELGEVRERELAAALAAVRVAVESGQDMEMSGVVREVYIGPGMLAEVGTDAQALLERIRRVQYIEAEGFEFVARSNLGLMMGLGVDLGFSIWNPERAQAFGPTSHLGMAASVSLHVPLDVLPELLGNRFARLDEKQFTIDAVPEHEIPQLVERAKPFTFNPYKKLEKKWWQFWK